MKKDNQVQVEVKIEGKDTPKEVKEMKVGEVTFLEVLKLEIPVEELENQLVNIEEEFDFYDYAEGQFDIDKFKKGQTFIKEFNVKLHIERLSELMFFPIRNKIISLTDAILLLEDLKVEYIYTVNNKDRIYTKPDFYEFSLTFNVKPRVNEVYNIKSIIIEELRDFYNKNV